MKPWVKKLALLLLVAILLLPFAAYWLVNAWLESSGGRQMLEQELSRRVGMSVRLAGDFDLMLFPDIGVAGTQLLVGGEPDSLTLFSLFQEYEISVALKPLFHRQVIVEWIRLTGGRVIADRYLPVAENGEAGPARLPEVQELTLRDFEIVLPAENAPPLRLKSLEITDFAEGRQTAFAIEVESLAIAQGWLRWDTAQSSIRFGDLELDLGGQRLGGEGCLLLEPWSLRVELQAETFDVDALMAWLPEFGAGGGDGDLPLDVRARLNVDELSSSGMTAQGVGIELGDDPDCD